MLTDHDERHICFAEARWEGSAEGTNSADGTGRFFEGRATQVSRCPICCFLMFVGFGSGSTLMNNF
jgi:hypothetical protein